MGQSLLCALIGDLAGLTSAIVYRLSSIVYRPWQNLYLRPLPQGQGSLRPGGLLLAATPAGWGTGVRVATGVPRLPRLPRGCCWPPRCGVGRSGVGPAAVPTTPATTDCRSPTRCAASRRPASPLGASLWATSL